MRETYSQQFVGPLTALQCALWITSLSDDAEESLQNTLDAETSPAASSPQGGDAERTYFGDVDASSETVDYLSIRILTMCLEFKDFEVRSLAIRALTLLFRAARDRDARCRYNFYAAIAPKINEATDGSDDRSASHDGDDDGREEIKKPTWYHPQKLTLYKPDPEKGEKTPDLFALLDRMSVYFGFRGIAAISMLLTDDLHVCGNEESDEYEDRRLGEHLALACFGL